MTKSELVTLISEEVSIRKHQAECVLESLENALAKELRTEGRVTLHNICTLRIKHRAERNCRNPQTGEAIVVPAHNVVTAKPHSAMKKVADKI